MSDPLHFLSYTEILLLKMVGMWDLLTVAYNSLVLPLSWMSCVFVSRFEEDQQWMFCGCPLQFPLDILQVKIGRRISFQPQRCSAMRVAMILTLPLQQKSLMLSSVGVFHASPPGILLQIVALVHVSSPRHFDLLSYSILSNMKVGTFYHTRIWMFPEETKSLIC